MLIAKVTGSLVATEKVGSMVGHKLLLVEPYRLDPKNRESLLGTGRSMVAVDTVGAGVGELVLLTQGPAWLTPETSPCRSTQSSSASSTACRRDACGDKEGIRD